MKSYFQKSNQTRNYLYIMKPTLMLLCLQEITMFKQKNW
jgi:hypothetical protein